MDELSARLVAEGLLSDQQLTLARQESAKSGKSLWSSLMKLKLFSADEIMLFFSRMSGIAWVKISDYAIKEEVLGLLDEPFCRQNSVMPLFKVKDTLFIACLNPLDTALMDRLGSSSGLFIEPLLSNIEAITRAHDEYYGPQDESFIIEKFLVQQNPLQGLQFRRESERLPLHIPVRLKLVDAAVRVKGASSLEGFTRNISSSGAAVSLQVLTFLPKTLHLVLEFNIKKDLTGPGELISATGEIVYCNVEKSKYHILGIRFIQISKEGIEKLLSLTENQ